MIMVTAADHGGFELKEEVKAYLKKTRPDMKIVDLGTDSTDPVDYPEYGRIAGEAVANGKADLGLVFCGTGIGISIAANKVKGTRCALCTSVYMGEMAKKHNNANLLAFGGRTTTPEIACQAVDAWLDNKWMGTEEVRHARRLAQIAQIEER